MNTSRFSAFSSPQKTPTRGLTALAFLIAMIALAAPGWSTPASEKFGVGIILGSPSGISLKIPQGAHSINVIVGYDLNDDDGGPGRDWGNDYLYVGGDYIWYNYSLIRVPQGRLPLYYGPGLYAAISDPRSVAGARFAVGLEYQFATAPFDIFLELGPRINVIPNTDADLFVGLGARFFF